MGPLSLESPSAPLRFAYYCSGHGYGHATRVSAFSRHLRNLSEENDERPIVYIVSSAPRQVFADSIACGALYRYAEIDPVIVQPLAYRVDRAESLKVLKAFLAKKNEMLERERKWLQEINAHSVLSDAAFLGCLSAKAAGIPSILITNFSFDSVYSYLSTPIIDVPATPDQHNTTRTVDFLISDAPIALKELEPLIEQIQEGYRCADLLVLLPGYIPIPSFFPSPPLPSSTWVDVESKRMHPDIIEFLSSEPWNSELLPSLPSRPSAPGRIDIDIPRAVIPAPLLVRPPDHGYSVYTSQGRSELLNSIGVPSELHGTDTKILIVSFGGQNFHQPSWQKTHSRSSSFENLQGGLPKSDNLPPSIPLKDQDTNGFGSTPFPDSLHLNKRPSELELHILQPKDRFSGEVPTQLATESHIWAPGAFPACRALASPTKQTPRTPIFNTIPPSPPGPMASPYFELGTNEDNTWDKPSLLPDESWIAIICGVSKQQWLTQDGELPQGFYIAPRDIYMPNLTAIGDVLLGKLGYGTVSECVDACTPFVYVSRPLFIEEHGLRLLLERDGVGIELPRQSYEVGDWSSAIHRAWEQGKAMKEVKRTQVVQGIGLETRDQEGRELAKTVVDWVKDWMAKVNDGYPLADTSV